MRRNVFDCKDTDKGSYPHGTGDALHVKLLFCLLCAKQPSGWLFSKPCVCSRAEGWWLEKEAPFTPSSAPSLAGISYNLNEGSVADMNYSSLFLCREVPVDIKSLSELTLTKKLVLIQSPELEWTKKLIYLLNFAFQLLGKSAVGFALCFCGVKRSLDFGLPSFCSLLLFARF